MALIFTDDQNYSDIADAIRAKNGSQATYTPSQMADAIEAISGGGSGASNFVTGTFTTGSTDSTMAEITIPYNGNGYPIFLMIVVEGGIYNSATNPGWVSSTKRYSVGAFYMHKSNTNYAPTYGETGTENMGAPAAIYKNSTTSSTTFGGTGGALTNFYSDQFVSGSAAGCVKLNSNTKLCYRTSGGTSSTYGLLANTTYRYYVLYSE